MASRDSGSEESRQDGMQPPLHIHPSQVESNREPRQSGVVKVSVRRNGSSRARIRFAPTSPGKLPRSARCDSPQSDPVALLSPLTSRLTSRLTQLDSLSHTSTILEQQMRTMQCFQMLRQWCESSNVATTKARLTQIYEKLVSAAYAASTTDEPSISTDPSMGDEYFTLLRGAEDRLGAIEADIVREQTKLRMEQALEADLTGELQQLEQDLTRLRQKHSDVSDEVENEQSAVSHLEQEFAMMSEQESDMTRECGILAGQLDKQRALLQELHEQSTYLDYVSHAPMRRHLEERKLQEQQEVAVSVAEAAERENDKLELELARLELQAANLEQQYQRDLAMQETRRVELKEAEELHERIELNFLRARECHTPRPHWSEIIGRTPELSVQKYEWEVEDNPIDTRLELSDSELCAEQMVSEVSTPTTAVNNSPGPPVAVPGQTRTLVKEMMTWIERLQKHCGVNLHLSRIWHDIEEARVELNILHQQLDHTQRKSARHSPTRAHSDTPGSSSDSPLSKSKQAYIVALGLHDEVPMFLRHQGKVKQRVLKKSEVENLVRKVWSEKRKREKRNPLANFALDDILYEKLQRKYGFQPLIAEWGYNLLLALQSYSWDTEIELFLLCLTRAVSDRVYVDQEEMLLGCQALLLKLTECYGIESFVTEHRVLLKDALVVLRKFFPLKSSSQLQAIEKSIIRDMHKMKRGGNDSILYIEDILPLGVSHPRGFFVKTIRTQHFKEIQDFYVLLRSELDERDTNRTGSLALSEIREAVQIVDPLSNPGTICNSLMKALGYTSRSQLVMHDVVDYRALLKRMNTSCLMKFTLNFDPNAEINWRRRRNPETDQLSASENKAEVPSDKVA